VNSDEFHSLQDH